MSAVKQLEVLVGAISKLSQLPITELSQNKTLVKNMTDVLSSAGLVDILNQIRDDYRAEQDAKFHAHAYTQDENFLQTFGNFKNAAHKILSTNAQTFYTEPVNMNSVQAFNSKQQQNINGQIEKLPEAQKFASVYNSIFSERSLQINSPNDPTRLQSFIDYSPYLYNYAFFLSIPTLMHLVKRPINMAMKKLPLLECEKNDLTKMLLDFYEEEDVEDILNDYLKYSALSPRGSLLVPIIENGRVRFNVFNDTQFTYGAISNSNSITQRYTKTKVGDIYCMGTTLKNEISCLFNCMDFEPLYAIGSNKLFQLKEAAEALNIYIYTIKVLCVRAQIIIQKTDGEGQTDTKLEQISAQLQRMAGELSMSTPLVQPEGNELDILNNNISPGFADVAPVLKDFIGILGGIAPDYHFGSDAAYQANSFNIHVTGENILADIQKPQLKPAYQFINNTLLNFDERFSAYKQYTNKVKVKFESIYEETEKEKAELTTIKTDNLIKQRDYPELEEAFKAEKLLPEKITFANIPAPDPEGKPGKGTGDGTPEGDVADTDETQGLGTRPPGNTPT